MAFNALEFARSEIEWMSDEVVKAFDETRENAFLLRHVHTAHKIPAAAAVRGPKVLLVTDSELQSGMSSLMLPAFLGQPNSLVLLTQSAREGSAAAALAAQPTPVQVAVRCAVRCINAE